MYSLPLWVEDHGLGLVQHTDVGDIAVERNMLEGMKKQLQRHLDYNSQFQGYLIDEGFAHRNLAVLAVRNTGQ